MKTERPDFKQCIIQAAVTTLVQCRSGDEYAYRKVIEGMINMLDATVTTQGVVSNLLKPKFFAEECYSYSDCGNGRDYVGHRVQLQFGSRTMVMTETMNTDTAHAIAGDLNEALAGRMAVAAEAFPDTLSAWLKGWLSNRAPRHLKDPDTGMRWASAALASYEADYRKALDAARGEALGRKNAFDALKTRFLDLESSMKDLVDQKLDSKPSIIQGIVNEFDTVLGQEKPGYMGSAATEQGSGLNFLAGMSISHNDAHTLQIASEIFGFKVHKMDEVERSRFLRFAKRIEAEVPVEGDAGVPNIALAEELRKVKEALDLGGVPVALNGLVLATAGRINYLKDTVGSFAEVLGTSSDPAEMMHKVKMLVEDFGNYQKHLDVCNVTLKSDEAVIGHWLQTITSNLARPVAIRQAAKVLLSIPNYFEEYKETRSDIELWLTGINTDMHRTVDQRASALRMLKILKGEEDHSVMVGTNMTREMVASSWLVNTMNTPSRENAQRSAAHTLLEMIESDKRKPNGN